MPDWGPYIIIALFLGMSSCAIPQMPEGGPVDSVPPRIIETSPRHEDVNVSTRTIRIVFNEYVDQASFAQSISITPEFDAPLEIRWRKKRVDIQLPDTLRPNTTYILTLDTNLSDVNRVKLSSPVTLAFATGPRINKGTLAGQVIDPARGKGLAGIDLLAYSVQDSLLLPEIPEKPAYRTQSDQRGAFRFSYLSEQDYYIVALRDLNRNKRPDGNEPFGVPPMPILYADSVLSDSTRSWYLASRDTIPPRLQRIRPISSRRFALQFSEAVRLPAGDSLSWSLTDSTSGDAFPIETIYQSHLDRQQVFFSSGVLFASTHQLIAGGLTDSTGNPMRTDTLYFRPSSSTDTLQTRFIRWEPLNLVSGEAGFPLIPPTTYPGIRFNMPPDLQGIQDLIEMSDTTGNPVAFRAFSEDGTLVQLEPLPAAVPGQIIQLSLPGTGVAAPDTVYRQTVMFISEEQLGELGGVVAGGDSLSNKAVELIPAGTTKLVEPQILQRVDSTFLFPGLPADGQFRFRAFLDINGNAQWDGGTLLPYTPAEPLTWSNDSLTVRARWETTLADTLKIPSLSDEILN